MVTLLKIFPDHDTKTIRRALVQHGRIELAADALSTSSDHNSFTSEKLQKAELSAHDTLKKRKRKMKSALCAERLKVEDEEDTAIDFLRYYKSKDFDASIPITVRYKGQPGVRKMKYEQNALIKKHINNLTFGATVELQMCSGKTLHVFHSIRTCFFILCPMVLKA